MLEQVKKYESPFIDDIQYAWDSTSLGWLKECPRKWYYAMKCGWRLKGETVNLFFGGLYHKGLEHYDIQISAGADHEEALRSAVHLLLKATWIDGKPWVSDHLNKTRETLIRSVIWYLDHFGAHDPAKTVQLANGKPAVELSFKLNLKDLTNSSEPYVLCGHLDRLVEFSNGVYGLDRKTTSTTINSNWFDQFSPDNQMSTYSVATKIIYNQPIKGIIIDAAQVAIGFTRFSRGFTYRTPAELDEWLADVQYWFEVQADCAEKKRYPMNDKSCHKYGGCEFRKVCSRSPEVRDAFLLSDYEKREWNPLEPR